jgi:hypothetical protein
MTPEPASQPERPPPPTPRFPGPDQVLQCVEDNSTEGVGIAIGLFTFSRPRQVNGAYWYWFQKWSPAPVVWFRLFAVGWLISWGVLLVFWALQAVGVYLVSNPIYISGPFWFVYIVQLLVVGNKAKIAFAREVLEHEGMVCFDCGYSLKNLPDKHICPECGAAYEKSALQARWLEWMRAKEPYKM